MPDAWLHEPWRWPGAASVIGRAYPAPLVDPVRAAAQARDAVWHVRQGAGFRAAADQILRRHASRKDGSGRFVRDPVANAPKDRQMRFDF